MRPRDQGLRALIPKGGQTEPKDIEGTKEE